MAALAPDLSKLTINVPATTKIAGLVVKRDGNDLGESAWGVPIPVDPGPHTIAASAPGHEDWSSTVQVSAKRDQAAVTVPALEASPTSTAPPPVAVTPPPAQPSPPSPSPPPEDASRGNVQRYIGVGVGAVGVVGLGVGAVFGLFANGKKSDATANCNRDLSQCNDAGVASMKSARTDATISTIGVVAGAALVTGGIVLFLTAPKAGEGKTVGVGVTPNAGGANLSLRGAW